MQRVNANSLYENVYLGVNASDMYADNGHANSECKRHACR